MLMPVVHSYLAFRRAVGYQLTNDEALLKSFARFAAERGDAHVRSETVLAWATMGPSPEQREQRLRAVVRLARHARATDGRHEIPPVGYFSVTSPPRRLPHIFSPDEIRRLLQEACGLAPRETLRPWTYYMIFGLLACTGMRISEALRLRMPDITPDGLMIRETKFRKTRLLPLHDTAASMLDRYIERRQRMRYTDDHVFLSLRGRPYRYQTVVLTFLRILRRMGLHPGAGQPGPHLHDLRHGFAVRSLESCPDARENVGRHVQALSTYLGHCGVAHTYWYLHVTPRLMTDMADARERAEQGGRP